MVMRAPRDLASGSAVRRCGHANAKPIKRRLFSVCMIWFKRPSVCEERCEVRSCGMCEKIGSERTVHRHSHAGGSLVDTQVRRLWGSNSDFMMWACGLLG